MSLICEEIKLIVTPKYSGRYIIDFKRPVGKVYHLDGTITENVTRINIKRKPDGTLRYADPVTETYKREKDRNMISNRFEIRLKERNLENLAPPTDDPLGELSDFELGIRKFCYEYDCKVSVRVGHEEYFVFLDPDICMILEDNLPELIADLEIGKLIDLEFAESCWFMIKFVPIGEDIKCYLREFGYSTDEKLVMLNKQQVLDELRRLVTELMELAVNLGYISLEDKNKFIKPAFSDSRVLV